MREPGTDKHRVPKPLRVCQTPMSAELVSPNSPARQYAIERMPLGRIGEADKVAGAIVFLVSDKTSDIDSSEVRIEGGFITHAEVGRSAHGREA